MSAITNVMGSAMAEAVTLARAVDTEVGALKAGTQVVRTPKMDQLASQLASVHRQLGAAGNAAPARDAITGAQDALSGLVGTVRESGGAPRIAGAVRTARTAVVELETPVVSVAERSASTLALVDEAAERASTMIAATELGTRTTQAALTVRLLDQAFLQAVDLKAPETTISALADALGAARTVRAEIRAGSAPTGPVQVRIGDALAALRPMADASGGAQHAMTARADTQALRARLVGELNAPPSVIAIADAPAAAPGSARARARVDALLTVAQDFARFGAQGPAPVRGRQLARLEAVLERVAAHASPGGAAHAETRTAIANVQAMRRELELAGVTRTTASTPLGRASAAAVNDLAHVDVDFEVRAATDYAAAARTDAIARFPEA